MVRVGVVSVGNRSAGGRLPARPGVEVVLDRIVGEDPAKLGEAISQQLVHLAGPSGGHSHGEYRPTDRAKQQV